MVLLSVRFTTRFMSRWAQQSGLHFLPWWDPQLQGKATAVWLQLMGSKCCALLVGFWKGELVFGLVGWSFVGFGVFFVKFNVPSLPEGSEMEECCVGTATGTCCCQRCVLQRCQSSVGWQRGSAGTRPHSGGCNTALLGE